jgi:hypothetical protein
MGRVRRNGYIVEWFIGDHDLRHVHVYDSKGRFWAPSDKLVVLIKELKAEGKL